MSASADSELPRQLLDIEEIKRLKARYFRTLDLNDWEGFAQVFAENASIDVPEIDLQQTGRDAIVATLSATGGAVRTVHHGHMPEIELTGADTARGTWAMFDYVEWDLPEVGSGGWTGYGHYHETYIREEGAWRIETMRLSRIRLDHAELRPPAGSTEGT
jgi:hypothetical protein